MDSSCVISILSTHKFDSDRNKAFESIVHSVTLSSNDVVKLGRLYKFDSDRNEGMQIALVTTKNIQSCDLVKLAMLYKFDSDRNAGFRVLSPKLMPIVSSDLVTILLKYKYDSDRNDAITILSSHISLTASDFATILKGYKFDSDRAVASGKLASKIGNIPVAKRCEIDDEVDIKKIDVITLLSTCKNSSDKDNLAILEKSINSIDLNNIENICLPLSKYFKNTETFRQACEVLGINPNLVEQVVAAEQQKRELKIKENSIITIGNSTISKSVLQENSPLEVNDGDLNVKLTKTGDQICINVRCNYSSMSSTANIDDKITIRRSYGNVGITHTGEELIISV